ncbi:out at first protein [Aethina tumida]|uniref:out at first protein n=1 Tax=Aethina tumida TaxID=116153 RepID=UPI002147E8C0|nr:out at first protein [Aethina tumida]
MTVIECVVPGIQETAYLTALKPFPSTPNLFLPDNNLPPDPSTSLSPCTDMKTMWTRCQCHLEVCIGWYPCGLKYCKGKGQTKNSVMSYRCGIKTCRQCHLFRYYVGQKQQCLWDE